MRTEDLSEPDDSQPCQPKSLQKQTSAQQSSWLTQRHALYTQLANVFLLSSDLKDNIRHGPQHRQECGISVVSLCEVCQREKRALGKDSELWRRCQGEAHKLLFKLNRKSSGWWRLHQFPGDINKMLQNASHIKTSFYSITLIPTKYATSKRIRTLLTLTLSKLHMQKRKRCFCFLQNF